MVNSEWIFSAYEISKYDPKYYVDGKYIKDEWLGFFQLGKLFDGKVFTYDEYVRVEKKYVDFIINFFKLNSCKSVSIKGLENTDFKYDDFENSQHLQLAYSEIKNNDLVRLEDLSVIIQLNLRGFIWCKLFCSNTDEVAVRFGYDYIISVNSPLSRLEIKQLAEANELFMN